MKVMYVIQIFFFFLKRMELEFFSVEILKISMMLWPCLCAADCFIRNQVTIEKKTILLP